MLRSPPLAGVLVLLASVASGMALRAPSGERQASASIHLDGGEVTVHYRTLYYGQSTMNDVLASPKEREFYNRALPRKVALRLSTELDLQVGETRLRAGTHPFALVVLEDGGFGVRFGDTDAVHPLTVGEGPWVFTNLTCVLAADGPDDVMLSLFYGELAAGLRLRPAAPEGV